MLEFKLNTTTVVGKPKLAITLYSIQAEPDATRGIWSDIGLNDIYIICRSTEEAIDWTKCLNALQFDQIPVHIPTPVQNYLKNGEKATQKVIIRRSVWETEKTPDPEPKLEDAQDYTP